MYIKKLQIYIITQHKAYVWEFRREGEGKSLKKRKDEVEEMECFGEFILLHNRKSLIILGNSKITLDENLEG